MARRKEGQQYTFRRIHGRLVPIAISGTGGAVAADALRTKRVYQTTKTVIDRKRFVFQPTAATIPVFGDQLIMRSAGGKKIGQARYFLDGTQGTFSWLGINKAFRGKGHSKILSKAAAVEMRAAGATEVFNQVVSPGAVLSQYNPRRDRFLVESRVTKAGITHYDVLKKKDALKQATRWNRQYKATKIVEPRFLKLQKVTSKIIHGKSPVSGLQEIFSVLKGKTKYMSARDVFRETTLPKTIRRPFAPFRTTGNKAKIALGAALFVGGAAYAWHQASGKKRR